jgi:hypothetical protein
MHTDDDGTAVAGVDLSCWDWRTSMSFAATLSGGSRVPFEASCEAAHSIALRVVLARSRLA